MPIVNSITRFPAIAVALALFLSLTACGGADSRTPEQLAREAFAAIQKNDFAAYKKLCASLDDMLATIDKAMAGEVKESEKAQMAKFRERIKADYANEFEPGVKRNFEQVAKATDWSKIEIKSVDAKQEHEEGVDISSPVITLSNGKQLRLRDVIKTPSGWRIADDNPLRLDESMGDLKMPSPEDFKKAIENLKDAKDLDKAVKDAIENAKDATKDAFKNLPDVPKVP